MEMVNSAYLGSRRFSGIASTGLQQRFPCHLPKIHRDFTEFGAQESGCLARVWLSAGPREEHSPGRTEPENLLLLQPFLFIHPAWVQLGNGGPLPEHGWNQPTIFDNPAGQESRAQTEIGSSAFQPSEEVDNAVIHSLSHNEIRESTVQQNGLSESSEPQTHGRPVNNTLRCGNCGLLFSKQHLFK